MRYLLWAALFAVSFIGYVSTGRSAPVEVQAIQTQMIEPTALVVAGPPERTSTGSGTVIYSGEKGTFVITAAHVTVRAAPDGVRVRLPIFVDGLIVGTSQINGRTVAQDTNRDLALVQVLSEREFPVAAVADSKSVLYPGETVWQVGYPKEVGPAITSGFLNTAAWTDSDVQNRLSYSAATWNGNSGGGVYHIGPDGYELIGVSASIESTDIFVLNQIVGPSFGITGVSHIAFAVAVDDIVPFLVENGFGFTLIEKLAAN